MSQEHMSAAQLRAHLGGGTATSSGHAHARAWGGKRPGPSRRAPHKAGQMNKLEAEYLRTVLEPRLASGEILAIVFEGHTLRMADRTGYTPDFLVVTRECFEFHEVKGHWEDDARVKWKVAAELNWFYRFFAATRRKKADGGGFAVEEYGQAEMPAQIQGLLT